MKSNYYFMIVAFIFTLTTFSYSQEWHQCNNGPNGELSQISAIMSDGTNLYVGTWVGLFKSTDYGDSWLEIDNGITDKIISSLLIKGDKIFVCTQDSGVFVSMDNGKNWQARNTGLTFKKMHRIINNGDDIYLGTYGGGVFLSTNNGENWENISKNFTSAQNKIYSMLFKDNNLYVGTYTAGIFTTEDKGANWKTINTGLNNNLWATALVEMDNNIFAGTVNMSNPLTGGIFKSIDKGQNWSKITTCLADNQIWSLYKKDDMILVGSYGKAAFSKDKGITWNDMSVNLPKQYVHSFIECGNYYYSYVSSSGLYKIEKSVDVKENLLSDDLVISPNPASDFITVTLKLTEGSAIYIYNTLGEKVMSVGAENILPVQINISDLPKGTYLIKVGDRSSKFLKK